MLRACGQALRPGGRIAVLTIQPTPGLPAGQRRKANRSGPPEVALRTSYPSLLQTAGFGDISETDVTAEYRSTMRRWLDATELHAAMIRQVIGDDTYEERAAQRQRDLRSIDDGLLSRFRYTATRVTRQ